MNNLVISNVSDHTFSSTGNSEIYIKSDGERWPGVTLLPW